MKLRNKKTGEIMDDAQYRNYSTSDGFGLRMDGKEWEYHSLAELNAEWEDVEDPKEYWLISPVDADVEQTEMEGDEVDTFNRQIGNYFSSREEAEKAVEKLKAWKRLKDKGFKIDGYYCYNIDGEKSPHIDFSYPNFGDLLDDDEVVADLDLLFVGEEGE